MLTFSYYLTTLEIRKRLKILKLNSGQQALTVSVSPWMDTELDIKDYFYFNDLSGKILDVWYYISGI